jgi:ribosomal protein L37AE/L43A
MTPIENPECNSCDAAYSVERIGDRWSCSCCGKSWPVGQKRDPPKRPKTDLAGVFMDDDG